MLVGRISEFSQDAKEAKISLLQIILLQLFLSAVFAVKLSTEVIFKGNENCDLSCETCAGIQFYECVTCKKEGILFASGYIKGVTDVGLSGKEVAILTGSCQCENSFQIEQIQQSNLSTIQNQTQCIDSGSLDIFSFQGIKAVTIGTFILGIARFILELGVFYLLEFLDVIQFMSNSCLLNSKDLLIQKNILDFYLYFNPIFGINEQGSFLYSQIFGEDEKQVETVDALAVPPNSFKNGYTTVQVIKTNSIQNSYFKLSRALSSHNPSLSFSSTSLNYFWILLLSLIISGSAYLLHKKYFKKFFFLLVSQIDDDKGNKKQILEDEISSFQSKVQIQKFKKQIIMDYNSSKYFKALTYIFQLPLIVFYSSLNILLIYLQISFTNPVKSDIYLIILYFLTSILIMGIIVKKSLKPQSHLILEHTVIFENILTEKSCLVRQLTIIKIVFKTLESILFFQLYFHPITQQAFILTFLVLQVVFFLFLQPFSSTSQNIFLILTAIIKTLITILRLIILISQSSPKSLQILIPTYSFIQLGLIFILFFSGLALFVLYLYFFISARLQRTLLLQARLEQISSNSKLNLENNVVNQDENKSPENNQISLSYERTPDKSKLILLNQQLKQQTSFVSTIGKGDITTNNLNNSHLINNNNLNNITVTYSNGDQELVVQNETMQLEPEQDQSCFVEFVDKFSTHKENQLGKFSTLQGNVIDDSPVYEMIDQSPRKNQNDHISAEYKQSSQLKHSQLHSIENKKQTIKEITISPSLSKYNPQEFLNTLISTSSAGASLSTKGKVLPFNEKKRYFEAPSKTKSGKKQRVYPYPCNQILNFSQFNDPIQEEDPQKNQESSNLQ